MINRLDFGKKKTLDDLPSAQAQDFVPKAEPARRRWGVMRVLAVALGVVLLLFAGAGFMVYQAVTSGPVGNEQMRAAIESQISTFLGDGYAARVGEASVTYGKSGLLALDAKRVSILKDDFTNLGVAKRISVNVEPFPLLQGEVVARSIVFQDAAISMTPFDDGESSMGDRVWPETVNLAAALQGFGGLLRDLAENLDAAGLRSVEMRETRLVGFDSLGLRSRSARLLEFQLSQDSSRDADLTFSASLALEAGVWLLEGTLDRTEQDGWNVAFDLKGLNIDEFLNEPIGDKPPLFWMDSPVELAMRARYDAEGQPTETGFTLDLGEGAFNLGKDQRSRLRSARLDFRILPEKNQIELLESPVVFEGASMILIGGMRFPDAAAKKQGDERLRIELIANDIVSQAISSDLPPARAAFHLNGWIDPRTGELQANQLSLQTLDGKMEGQATIGLASASPALKMELSAETFPVDEFKQLWPQALATGARRWAVDGVQGGLIRNASFKADMPEGILFRIDDGARFEPQHIEARLPLEGVSVKTTGDLPHLQEADGLVAFKGMQTEVSFNKATAKLASGRRVALKSGTLHFGDFTPAPVPVKLDLHVAGNARAMGELATRKPLAFMEDIGARPGDLSGALDARIDGVFELLKGGAMAGFDWRARVDIKNGASKTPFEGRRFSNADLRIEAEPGTANITGTANIDGVAATVAMVQHFGPKSGSGSSTVTLTLDDKARAKMGIDTDDLVKGPVDVTLTELPGGASKVDVDLRKAQLRLPWINWKKGKGIASTASFTMRAKNGATRVTDLVLRGDRFGARGSLSFDKKGLAALDLSNVRLNKQDDFNLSAKRGSKGLELKVSGRSIDVRPLIQTLLEDDGASRSSKASVRVTGQIDRAIGHHGQELGGVSIDYQQVNGQVSKARVSGVATGNAPTLFSMAPESGIMTTRVTTRNAGSILRFLNIYTKVRGGNLEVALKRTKGLIFSGEVSASDFLLLDEPRLGQLLQPPRAGGAIDGRDGDRLTQQIRRVDPSRVKVNRLAAVVRKGTGYLLIDNGRLQGGDAGAAFKGTVYDGNNRMKIVGTFLPAYGLNQIVSKIPILGLALGGGEKTGLVGITFRLSGPYKNPTLLVNPMSIMAPGVFRKLFEF